MKKPDRRTFLKVLGGTAAMAFAHGPLVRAFAEGNGVPSRAFDLDHYDVPVERWDELVAAGAEPVSPRELVRRLAASGLRVTPRERHGRGGPERHHR